MRQILFLLIFIFFHVLSYSQILVYFDKNIPVQTSEVTSVKISSDGRFLAYGTDEKGKVYIYDLVAKRELHQLQHNSNYKITSLLFDSKNQYMVSGSEDKTIIIWDLYSGKIQKTITEYNGKVSHLALSPDEKFLAVGGSKKEIYLFDFPGGMLKGRLLGIHKKGIFYTTFNLRGTQLLSIGHDNIMAFWDPFKLKMIRKSELKPNTIKGSDIELRSAKTSHDKKIIGIGYEEMMLAKGGKRMIFKHNTAFYDWETGMEIKTIEGNAKKIDVLSLSFDGKYYLTDNSTLRENKISFWNFDKGAIEQKQLINGNVTAIDLAEEGNLMVVAHNTGKGSSNSFVDVYQLSGMQAPSYKPGYTAVNQENKQIYTDSKETDDFISTTVITDGKKIFMEGKYYALIIGINDYEDPMINDLDEPLKDARNIYDILTGSYTFNKENIIFLKNPVRAEIIDALDHLEDIITPKDNLLIFYAGHGYWDEESQKGYWLPADVREGSTANWFRNSSLSGYISSIKANHTLLIADACFSGSIFKTRKAFNTPSKSIQRLYNLPSRKAMTSGTLKEVPDRSIFLYYLTKRLVENEEDYLPSEQLFASFKPAVLNNSNNIPQYGEIKNAGDEGGDFIFIRKPVSE